LELKTGGETLQCAVVCCVNKIKYPDEVLAKLMQLKHVDYKPVEEEPEYKTNQQRNYERYLFVTNKYMPKLPMDIKTAPFSKAEYAEDEQDVEEELLTQRQQAQEDEGAKLM
jgi:hypothetical protein